MTMTGTADMYDTIISKPLTGKYYGFGQYGYRMSSFEELFQTMVKEVVKAQLDDIRKTMEKELQSMWERIEALEDEIYE